MGQIQSLAINATEMQYMLNVQFLQISYTNFKTTCQKETEP